MPPTRYPDSWMATRERHPVDANYPGTAQALTDVIADRVPVIVDSISALIGLLQAVRSGSSRQQVHRA